MRARQSEQRGWVRWGQKEHPQPCPSPDMWDGDKKMMSATFFEATEICKIDVKGRLVGLVPQVLYIPSRPLSSTPRLYHACIILRLSSTPIHSIWEVQSALAGLRIRPFCVHGLEISLIVQHCWRSLAQHSHGSATTARV